MPTIDKEILILLSTLLIVLLPYHTVHNIPNFFTKRLLASVWRVILLVFLHPSGYRNYPRPYRPLK